jgi:hypothetical protein
MLNTYTYASHQSRSIAMLMWGMLVIKRYVWYGTLYVSLEHSECKRKQNACGNAMHSDTANVFQSSTNTRMLCYFLTNYMEQFPPLETSSRSASQEISSLLTTPKFDALSHSNPPLTLILGQLCTMCTFLTCFPKIHFNIVLILYYSLHLLLLL